jgi:Peptidase C10 family
LYNNGNVGYLAWIDFVNQVNSDLNDEVSKIKKNALPPCGGNGDLCGNSYSYTKGPLLPCTWGQGCTFNEDCPQLGCSIGCWGNEAYTGCVATSISQILRKHSKVSSANYIYNTMPIGNGNSEVQRLMAVAGLAVSSAIGLNFQYASDYVHNI